MGRLEMNNGDGTLTVDGTIVHMTPSAGAVAFVDEETKERTMRAAADARDIELLKRLDVCPTLSDDPAAIRVTFVTPDPEIDQLIDVLGDQAWDAETGRLKAYLSYTASVVDGVVYQGCGHFHSEEEQKQAMDIIAASSLTKTQKKRLIKRCADTPILVSV